MIYLLHFLETRRTLQHSARTGQVQGFWGAVCVCIVIVEFGYDVKCVSPILGSRQHQL